MRLARVAIDTHILVSALLRPDSVPARAYLKALDSADLVFSPDMVVELYAVLRRPKFDRYVQAQARERYLHQLLGSAKVIAATIRITVCRDPRENHILEAAVNGSAETVVTGDKDLLDLNPFHGIRILTPLDYLGHSMS